MSQLILTNSILPEVEISPSQYVNTETETESAIMTPPIAAQELNNKCLSVFGHRTMKTSHPVRSAVDKHRIVRLVLQWVTMWESRMLNSFDLLLHFFSAMRKTKLHKLVSGCDFQGICVNQKLEMPRCLFYPYAGGEKKKGWASRVERGPLKKTSPGVEGG